ncbi:hypothetical protein [Actinomadura sp. CNU-125]|uniref:hypothetical protein n=1 Tax=Actinomadura sp. CNU-125 TaxID=1904961 RepID=UPI0021CC84C0|nr:hypothetical protein [Actinomadura sp. CNU-125]
MDDRVEEALADLGEHAAAGRAGASVRDTVRTRPWEAERAAARRTRRAGVAAGVGRHRRPALGTGAVPGHGGCAAPSARRRRRPGRGDRRADRAGSLLRAATLDAVLGQHDAPWLALLETLGRLSGARCPAWPRSPARRAGGGRTSGS